jgi:hypothetical protein
MMLAILEYMPLPDLPEVAMFLTFTVCVITFVILIRDLRQEK